MAKKKAATKQEGARTARGGAGLDTSEARACAEAIARGETGRAALREAVDSDAKVLAKIAVTEVREGRAETPPVLGPSEGAERLLGVLGVPDPAAEWEAVYGLMVGEERIALYESRVDEGRRGAAAIGDRIEETRAEFERARVETEERIAKAQSARIAAELGVHDPGTLDTLLEQAVLERDRAGEAFRAIARSCEEERRAIGERLARAKAHWETLKTRVVRVNSMVAEARKMTRELEGLDAGGAKGRVA